MWRRLALISWTGSALSTTGRRAMEQQFREDGFMQKQARAWAEAVLGESFGDDEPLADLLCDGSVLYRLSRRIMEMEEQPVRSGPASPLPPEDDGSKGGKYLPYARVDAFLKMCKGMGLLDVELFTPPDVVERKDVRRVCFCIRALSRKARSLFRLPLPDFDRCCRPPQQQAPATSPPRTPPPARHLAEPDPADGDQKDEAGVAEYGAGVAEDGAGVGADEGGVAADEGGVVADEGGVAAGEGGVAEDVDCVADDVGDVGAAHERDTSDDAVAAPPRLWLAALGGVAVAAAAAAAVALLTRRESGGRRVGGSSSMSGTSGTSGSMSSMSSMAVVEVKEGDTLSAISRRCGKSSWKELVELNPGLIADPNLIYPSDRLKLA